MNEPDDTVPEQGAMFDLDELSVVWVEWQGMPEFLQEDLAPHSSVLVHFAGPADRRAFAALVEQSITPKTQSLWYPPAEIGHMVNKRFRSEP